MEREKNNEQEKMKTQDMHHSYVWAGPSSYQMLDHKRHIWFPYVSVLRDDWVVSGWGMFLYIYHRDSYLGLDLD